MATWVHGTPTCLTAHAGSAPASPSGLGPRTRWFTDTRYPQKIFEEKIVSFADVATAGLMGRAE